MVMETQLDTSFLLVCVQHWGPTSFHSFYGDVVPARRFPVQHFAQRDGAGFRMNSKDHLLVRGWINGEPGPTQEDKQTEKSACGVETCEIGMKKKNE